MEKIKLNEEELQQINKLRAAFAENVNTLGLIHYQILDLETRKDKVEQDLLANQKQEQSLYQQLTERYGEGTILIETGEFVKN